MIRKALTILSLVGLLLCVGLWGASYFNILYLCTPLRSLFQLSKGCAVWTPYVEADYMTPRGGVVLELSNSVLFYSNSLYQQNRWVSLGYLSGTGLETRWLPSFNSGYADIWVPLWIPILLCLSAFSFCYLPVRRRRKRMKLGLCVKCEYDLRGSTERCPECGLRIED